jgi:hypothetical protein
VSEQDVPLNLFSFHVSSNWKIAGCIYEALECIKTMAECIGMYLNKNLRKKIVPRERREWQRRDFPGDGIIVSGIKILNVVVALIVELLEDCTVMVILMLSVKIVVVVIINGSLCKLAI